MKKDTQIDRLKLVLFRKDMTYKELGEIIDENEGAIKNYFSGRKRLRDETLSLISERLGIDYDWLISGKGDMFEGNVAEPEAPYGRHLIPYYDVDVMATPIEVFNDQSTVPSFNIDLPGFSDCDFAINIFGHSMYPTYESGTIVLCKRVHDKSLILYGEAYFIVTKDYRMVKRILKSDRKGYIIASSDNHNGHNSPDGKTYGSTEIHIDKILNLYMVKGNIKRTLI